MVGVVVDFWLFLDVFLRVSFGRFLLLPLLEDDDDDDVVVEDEVVVKSVGNKSAMEGSWCIVDCWLVSGALVSGMLSLFLLLRRFVLDLSVLRLDDSERNS